MKKVYYRGEPYEFKVTGDQVGKRQFQLFKNGIFTYFVEEQDLDKPSLATMVLESYYRNFKTTTRSAILS
jgi:hypothetical protein